MHYDLIGLMSGTSLDGLDVAGCRFWREKQKWKCRILNAVTVPYSQQWKEKLENSHGLNGRNLIFLDREFGNFTGKATVEFIEKNGIDPVLISSHGHTVYHRPAEGCSYQIGDGAVISAVTGKPVVSDFRQGDVALGGQGAPLVPVGDHYLFDSYDFCLNLGGIANISMLDRNGSRVAFDIGPCNLLLNHLAGMKGMDYDAGGILASKGKVKTDILEVLERFPFYRQSPPRSLDKKDVQAYFFPVLEKYQDPVEDLLATVVGHIASHIARETGKLKKGNELRMLVTGGGALNEVLLERIRSKTTAKVICPDNELVMYKEALVFAFLGLLRSMNRVNCFASVTGASRDHVSGSLYGER